MNFVSNMEKPRILVADDDLDDRMLMISTFKKLGHADHVKVVEGGKPVIDYLSDAEAEDIKLIVLDMNMPILNGVDTLRILKSHSRHREIPVVIFSTSVSERDKNLCRKLGANEFIVKPIRYLEYVDICNKFYEISR